MVVKQWQMSTGPVPNLAGQSSFYTGQEFVNDEHVSLGDVWYFCQVEAYRIVFGINFSCFG